MPVKEDADKCGQDARAPGLDDLTEILNLCQRLSKIGATRILYTSRENLPAAHHNPRQTTEQMERLPPPAKPGLFAKLGKLLGRKP